MFFIITYWTTILYNCIIIRSKRKKYIFQIIFYKILIFNNKTFNGLYKLSNIFQSCNIYIDTIFYNVYIHNLQAALLRKTWLKGIRYNIRVLEQDIRNKTI